MSPNRIVAFLTPLVFAPLAGACASWLAAHFPGTDIKESDLQAIFIGGALIALAPAVQWLHGWQKHEAREADAEHAVELANAAAIAAPTFAPAEAPEGAQDFAEGGDDDGLAILDEFDGMDDFADELLPEDGEPAATLG